MEEVVVWGMGEMAGVMEGASELAKERGEACRLRLIL